MQTENFWQTLKVWFEILDYYMWAVQAKSKHYCLHAKSTICLDFTWTVHMCPLLLKKLWAIMFGFYLNHSHIDIKAINKYLHKDFRLPTLISWQMSVTCMSVLTLYMNFSVLLHACSVSLIPLIYMYMHDIACHGNHGKVHAWCIRPIFNIWT